MRECTLKHLMDYNFFVEYSNDMDDLYKMLKNTMQIKNEKYW